METIAIQSQAFFQNVTTAGDWPFLKGCETQLFSIFSKGYYSMMNWDRDMKLKPYEAQNTIFSEYERSLLISCAT